MVGLDVNRWWRAHARWFGGWIRELLVALSAMEPIYYPRIVGTLSLRSEDEFAQYQRWRTRLRLTETRKWLGVDAEWIKQNGAALLRRADSIDPLGDWLELVREANPGRWKRLQGHARCAMDARMAAELLLRYYDHLASGRRAKPLEQPSGRWRGEFDSRLKPKGKLERILTDYGLSPHPSLVLVVEGATELLLFPRVMEMFGIRRDEDFISVQDAGGVGTDLRPLVAYAVAPRTEAEDGRYLRLSRPLTRILVVTDAEGPMRTRQQRRERRDIWVERMLQTLPREHRTSSVTESLQRLVYVDTWTSRGLSFEFAHFTDRQLAEALTRLDQRRRRPTLEARIEHLSRIRARQGSIDNVMEWTSKLALANELWPVLERKITRAERRKTAGRIPIVRILDRATDLARELPRRNVVIGL